MKTAIKFVAITAILTFATTSRASAQDLLGLVADFLTASQYQPVNNGNQGLWNGGNQSQQVNNGNQGLWNGGNQSQQVNNGNQGLWNGGNQSQQSLGHNATINFLTSISGRYDFRRSQNGSRIGTLSKVGNIYRWTDNANNTVDLNLDIVNQRLFTHYTDQMGRQKVASFKFTLSQSGQVLGFYSDSDGWYFTRS